MGDTSVIARRLKDGTAEFGRSGDGGYFRNTGSRLLRCYQEPEAVDYLFGLGQTMQIGAVGSVHDQKDLENSNPPTGERFLEAVTEQAIFDEFPLVGHVYLYDLDNEWYYVANGSFKIKIPLRFLEGKIESKVIDAVSLLICKYMFTEYRDKDNPFSELLDLEDCKLGSISARNPIGYLRNNYYTVCDYFDKWVAIRCDSDYKSVTDILMRKKTKDHEETYLWDSGMQGMRLF